LKTKRKIFYIPGFDPRSEAYYKKLLLAQFPEIKDSLLSNEKSRVVFQHENLEVDYEILSWHKAIRSYWESGFLGNLKNVKTTFSDYVFKGTWGRLFKLSQSDGLQKAFSPYFFFIWLLLISFGLSYFSWSVLSGQATLMTLLVFVGFGIANVLLYRGLDKLNLFWVNRIMDFFVRYSKQEVPLVIQAEADFKAKVLNALSSNDYDEVVLVAHSVGTILCLSIMAELAEEGLGKDLTIVTLGHCVSGVSILPEAAWFNDKLRQIQSRKFKWIDVTSGKDAVTFYKVTPAYHAAVLPDLTLSAGFHEIFDKPFYTSLKWKFYQIHFLYLYHPQQPLKSPFNYQKLLFDADVFKRLLNAS
jgi:predicted alpha/beta hydrolase family esterase